MAKKIWWVELDGVTYSEDFKTKRDAEYQFKCMVEVDHIMPYRMKIRSEVIPTMKKTPFVCVTEKGSVCDKTQRVYTDDLGKRYIRKQGKYLCIEHLPCINHMFRA